MTDIPTDLSYSPDHLWVRSSPDSTVVRVGITDHAQEALGDIVSVTVPQDDELTSANTACGEIESTKSVSDLIAPVSGTVHAHNAALDQAPELINSDPYGQGWLFEIDLDPLSDQLAGLMDDDAYRRLVGA